MRDNKSKPLPPGELTDEEYQELVVKPNQERARKRMLSIDAKRAKNTRRSRSAARRKKGRRGLFDEDPGPRFKLFDD